jgi:hypothetical protein
VIIGSIYDREFYWGIDNNVILMFAFSGLVWTSTGLRWNALWAFASRTSRSSPPTRPTLGASSSWKTVSSISNYHFSKLATLISLLILSCLRMLVLTFGLRYTCHLPYPNWSPQLTGGSSPWPPLQPTPKSGLITAWTRMKSKFP